MPQEPLIPRPVLLIRTGDPIIRINARAGPFRVFRQQAGEIFVLRFIGILLVGRV